MSRLAGKVAVISGGSSGIGLATAQRFVDEGAHVLIVGRRQSGHPRFAVARTGNRTEPSRPPHFDKGSEEKR